MLRTAANYAGAVDQNVQLRKALHAGLDALAVTNVERDRAPGKAGSLPRCIRLGRCRSGNGNLRTEARQRASDRRADAGRTAANQRHVAGKKIRAKTGRAHCTDAFRNAATSACVGSGSTAP